MSEVNDLWLLIPGVASIVWAMILMFLGDKALFSSEREKIEQNSHRFLHTGLILTFLGIAL